MLKLKTHNIEPRGGWRYVDPDSLLEMRSNTFNNLVALTRRHRERNNWTVPENLEAIIEDYICQHTIREFVVAPEDSVFIGYPTINKANALANKLNDMMHGTDSPFMTVDAESERRSEICIACPRNNPTVCLSCDGYDKIFRDLFRIQATQYHRRLMACNCDHTANMVMVHLNPECAIVFLNTVEHTDYPDNCWKKPLMEK